MDRLLEHLKQIRAPMADEQQWRQKIQEWVDDFAARLAEIKAWLRPLLKDPGNPDRPLEWEDLKVLVVEGDHEAYSAPGARLICPRGRYVEIVPKARHVFKATGRVDLVSRKGRVLLARFGPRKWSFVWPDEDEWRSAELSADSLAKVLEEMLV